MDEFAAAACYSLAGNATIDSIKLYGNSISMKQIRNIDAIVHKNKVQSVLKLQYSLVKNLIQYNNFPKTPFVLK